MLLSSSKQQQSNLLIPPNNDNSSSNNPLHKLLLSVPFYVYDDLPWEDATWNGVPLQEYTSDNNHNHHQGNSSSSYFNPKHMGDYWFLKAALIHPLRTMNISEAKLFVIPTLNNLYDMRSYFKSHSLCVRKKAVGGREEGGMDDSLLLCNEDLMIYAAEQITTSPSFEKYPHAHVSVVSHFAHRKKWWNKGLPSIYRQMLHQSSNIQFEDQQTNQMEKWSQPKMHVGKGCPSSSSSSSFLPDPSSPPEEGTMTTMKSMISAMMKEKTQDVVMIATLKPNDPRFQDRDRLCSWFKGGSSSTGRNGTTTTSGNGPSSSTAPASVSIPHRIRMEYCGEGIPMCPALRQAKLGFHVRGDAPSSNRLFDTILSDTIPIFTRQEQYPVLPPWMDWDRISYFINILDDDDDRNDMTTATTTTKKKKRNEQERPTDGIRFVTQVSINN